MLHQVSHDSLNDATGSMAYSRLWIFPDETYEERHAWTTRPGHPWTPDDGRKLIDYHILAMSNDPDDRQEAMFGLAELGDLSSIEFLQRGLSDSDQRTREVAILSLAVLGGTQSVQALSVALNDPDVSLRVDAVDALGEIGGEQAIGLLQQAMTDESHRVREAAAEWLTELEWSRK